MGRGVWFIDGFDWFGLCEREDEEDQEVRAMGIR